jgi:hypothetical protein
MDVKLPDGTIINNVPDGISKAELTARLARNGYDVSKLETQNTAMPKAPKSYTAGEAVTTGLTNLPGSALKFAGDTVGALMHPIETTKGALNLAAGELDKLLPQSVSNALTRADEAFLGKEKAQEINARQKLLANTVNQQYKERYGSAEGFKRALAEDPANILADVSTVLTGGAALAPKASKLAGALTTASKYTNPLLPVEKAIGATASGIGSMTKGTLGVTTGAGSEPITQAVKAGEASIEVPGGKVSQAFTKNLRGASDVEGAVDIAKSGLDEMRKVKNAEYRSGMVDISNDKTALAFDDINNALKSASEKGTYKGQIKDEFTAKKVQEAADAVKQWKKLDPAEFHTPEGMDALKQKIGGILESVPFEQKTARTALNEIYNGVRQTIADQAPTYSTVMKDYAQSSELINEIKKSLSLGEKTSADTALRKLQSIMRNNVQTNYGNRAKLAEELVGKGGAETLMPTLAGQSLNSLKPRGLGGQLETYGGLAYLLTHPAALGSALALAPAAMPRVVGEAAYGVGKLKGVAKKVASKTPLTKDEANLLGLLLTQANQGEQ